MIIKEFLPNPVGNDQEGEYIKLFNNDDSAVNLNGWQVKDVAGKSYKISGDLVGDQELVLPYSQTKISLNNSGEKVFLYDASGKLVDELGYSGQANEGQIINKRLATSELATSKLETGELAANQSISNSQLPISNAIFLDFLTAAILAGLGLYIILQLEKKLEIKLF